MQANSTIKPRILLSATIIGCSRCLAWGPELPTQRVPIACVLWSPVPNVAVPISGLRKALLSALQAFPRVLRGSWDLLISWKEAKPQNPVKVVYAIIVDSSTWSWKGWPTTAVPDDLNKLGRFLQGGKLLANDHPIIWHRQVRSQKIHDCGVWRNYALRLEIVPRACFGIAWSSRVRTGVQMVNVSVTECSFWMQDQCMGRRGSFAARWCVCLVKQSRSRPNNQPF